MKVIAALAPVARVTGRIGIMAAIVALSTMGMWSVVKVYLS